MAAPRKERAYEKYAWILVFVTPAIIFIGPLYGGYFSASPDPSVIKAVTGVTLDQIGAQNPGTVFLIGQAYRDIGLAFFALGFIFMAVAAFPFRKGLRFAWYISWVFLAWLVGSGVSLSYLNTQLGGNNGLAEVSVEGLLVFIVIGLLGQLLPYRKFFPKKQPVGT